MSHQSSTDIAIDKINSIADELSREFYAHVKECQTFDPNMTNLEKIYEGWSIQKIAGLQYLVMDLTTRLIDLEIRVGITKP